MRAPSQELLPGITLHHLPDLLLLRSEAPLHTLSSAVVGGGFARVHYILNRHVHKHYTHPDPAADLRAFASEAGIGEPFVGMMTAAFLDQAHLVRLQHGDVTLVGIGTVGLSNPTAAGLTLPAPTGPGTINLILLVDAHLTPAAMVNAVITATEAKCAALVAGGVRSPAGHPASGTSTDAVVIACTGRGPAMPYAGPVTGVGWLIGRAVREIVQRHLASRA